ncbi:hypothetical protein [Mesorhizobium sp. M0859]|uniref:hypothetical protein n=1 Tax=Mesorhizobium sp. M0859 TaxID=2957014 RepID=UPI00333B6300
MSDLHDLVGRIAASAEKLLNEVARLRRDVARLHGKIEAFDKAPQIVDPEPVRRKLRNLNEALATIEAARKGIENSERAMNVIESRINEIAVDAISRSEMKPWLKDRG